MITKTSANVLVLASFRLPGGLTNAVQGRLTKAQRVISKEPGCLSYCFSLDLAETDLVRVTEHWRDQVALDTHMGNSHSAGLVTTLVTAGMTDFVVLNYSVTS